MEAELVEASIIIHRNNPHPPPVFPTHDIFSESKPTESGAPLCDDYF